MSQIPSQTRCVQDGFETTQVGTRRAMYSSVNVPAMPATLSSTSAPVPARGAAGALTVEPFGSVLHTQGTAASALGPFGAMLQAHEANVASQNVPLGGAAANAATVQANSTDATQTTLPGAPTQPRAAGAGTAPTQAATQASTVSTKKRPTTSSREAGDPQAISSSALEATAPQSNMAMLLMPQALPTPSAALPTATDEAPATFDAPRAAANLTTTLRANTIVTPGALSSQGLLVTPDGRGLSPAPAQSQPASDRMPSGSTTAAPDADETPTSINNSSENTSRTLNHPADATAQKTDAKVSPAAPADADNAVGAQPTSLPAAPSPDSTLMSALDLLSAGKVTSADQSTTTSFMPAATSAATQSKGNNAPPAKPAASTTGEGASANSTTGSHTLEALATAPLLPITAQKPVAQGSVAPASDGAKVDPQPTRHTAQTLVTQASAAQAYGAQSQAAPAFNAPSTGDVNNGVQFARHAATAQTATAQTSSNQSAPARSGNTAPDHSSSRENADAHKAATAQQDAEPFPAPQLSPIPAPLATAVSSAAPQAVAISDPAPSSAMTASSTGSSSTPSAATAEPTPAAPMGRVEVAKLLHTAAGSELRVGMQSDEFGAISIRTAFGREQLSAHISLDGDRPGSAALSSHLSSMQESLADRLGQDLGIKASISVSAALSHSAGSQTDSQTARTVANYSSNGATASGGNTASGNGQASGSSRQQHESPYRAAGVALGRDFAGTPTTSLGAAHQAGLSGRLDIRI